MQRKFILIVLTLATQSIPLSADKNLQFLYSSIHELRDSLDLKKLEIDKTLEIVAKEYVTNLSKHNVLTHTLFSTTPLQRVKKYDKHFCRTKEILAAGMGVRDIIDAWLSSPPHKEALLNKDTSRMGGHIVSTQNNKNIFIIIFGEKFQTN
ncbi:CAP domain-containing protein [Borrelia sp. BU AG58]|uniref:CAP domain-containing protein n=1 Tax=Borrelia sp. BU AG58 TaxID=2887345 RepID=UPI001E5A2B8A|nr:CAP domain-containing protein [Borrelia sp. BU AG58]UER67837.1 CAP domain-containing protein [Borrelia sp. BU AG58]